ncbi:hypothetical protein [Lacipirellula parvula]|uniref:hypothetical protein n=1 Tax=Lacipirellula parvula TaxID=2650471 RepID=UPI001E309F4B|nr:hypothetical protein [Lacipirellula parvula]
MLDDRRKHRALIAFRHLFREHDEQSFKSELLNSNGFGGINLTDYFEDESGENLDEVDLLAIISGVENPIIMGNVTSVLRLGPSEMLVPEEWGIQESNDVMHFLQLITLIQKGRWWNSKPKLSWSGKGPYRLQLGDIECFTAVFPLIRQLLLRRDDVFRGIANLYSKHVDSDSKRAWMHYEIDRFSGSLAGDWRFPPIKELCGVSNEDLLDALIYGSGLIHRASNKKMEDELARISQLCARETLMFAFDATCRHILEAPFNIAPLVHHEFSNWLSRGLCPAPTRVVLKWLFESEGQQN